MASNIKIGVTLRNNLTPISVYQEACLTSHQQ